MALSELFYRCNGLLSVKYSQLKEASQCTILHLACILCYLLGSVARSDIEWEYTLPLLEVYQLTLVPSLGERACRLMLYKHIVADVVLKPCNMYRGGEVCVV